MFSIQLNVRDYECDTQGIVNNAIYSNYFEHARHCYLLNKNHQFFELHKEGIELVLSTINIHYKKPLKPNDTFTVELNTKWKNKAKLEFNQQIIKKNGTLIATAIAIIVCTINGKPVRFPKKLENLAP